MPGGGGSGSRFAGVAKAESFGGFADGGPIEGPGGPRQDNLLARVSNGEFVIPADVVSRKGTEFFEKMIGKTREEGGEGGAPPMPMAPPSGLGFADGVMVMMPHGYADGGFLDESEGLNILPMSGSPGPLVFGANLGLRLRRKVTVLDVSLGSQAYLSLGESVVANEKAEADAVVGHSRHSHS